MSVCTYDNPSNWNRECWRDGRLICSYSARLLLPFAKDPIPGKFFFFGASVGPWEEGKLWGDAAALPERRYPGAHTHLTDP